ncbi:MAG: alpha/beta fold hydrolase [Dehalococcoidia bacterium]
MPHVAANGVNLYYEERGSGTPIVFVHEFAGDSASWHLQLRHFARRYRCIAYNARGYPPSEVPQDLASYSQDHAVGDLLGVLDGLGIERAHIVGLSMGGYATLHFGIRHPERCLSITVAGAGYGSGAEDREAYVKDIEATAERFKRDGMPVMSEVYTRGPTRVQFIDKDPLGWEEFRDQFAAQDALGHALTLQGVQLTRPTIFELEAGMRDLTVPTLIVVGDEDEPCLEPALFMKRRIHSSGLVVVPRTGHTINLEEPAAFNAAVEDFLATVDAGRWAMRNPASLGASQILPAEETTR